MKSTRILALFPALVIGASAFASSETLTFSGHCRVGLNGQAFTTIDTFHLEAKEGECPHKFMEFSVTDNGKKTEYGVYVEFQRSEFGPGLKDKPYFGYYEKSDGSLKNIALAFNVKPGMVLTFGQALKDGAHLSCSGNIK